MRPALIVGAVFYNVRRVTFCPVMDRLVLRNSFEKGRSALCGVLQAPVNDSCISLQSSSDMEVGVQAQSKEREESAL